MSAKKPKRYVYILERRTMEDGTPTLVLMHNGAIVNWLPGQLREAIRSAGGCLREFAAWFGQHSELRVRNRNGKIGETRTYPRSSDPRRSKG